jgi:hypothetical protein
MELSLDCYIMGPRRVGSRRAEIPVVGDVQLEAPNRRCTGHMVLDQETLPCPEIHVPHRMV